MARVFKIFDTEVLVSPNWTISQKINARATLNLTVVDLLTLTDILVGDSVEIENDSVVIFAGIVSKIDIREKHTGYLEYSIQAIDNNALADKRLIVETGSAETAGYIVENVILPYLADEGVTAGTIETGVTISKYTFNYIKCSSALDQIKTITGLNWRIDKDKKLHFFSNNSSVSPWVLSDNVVHSNFSQSRSLDSYRNVQYVRAGKGKTLTQTDEKPSPKPDSVSRTFNLKFPLAERPTIKIGAVTIDDADVGIKGLDDNKKYYFTYGSNTITQDDAETILSDSDVLAVTYIGLYDILVQCENETEIANRASIELGTSGMHESITEEKSITETDEAQAFGEGLLNKYGEIFDTIQFETNVAGLEAGQLLKVEKSLYGINESFLIESVRISPLNATDIQYSIKALDGASVGGWEEYFKEILRKQTTYVINENEKIIKIKKLSDVVTISDLLSFINDIGVGSEELTIVEELSATDAGIESRADYALVGYSEAV